MMQGSVEDKLKFAFNMYDMDGNGMINEQEVAQVFDEMKKSFTSMKLHKSGQTLPSLQEIFPQVLATLSLRVSQRIASVVQPYSHLSMQCALYVLACLSMSTVLLNPETMIFPSYSSLS